MTQSYGVILYGTPCITAGAQLSDVGVLMIHFRETNKTFCLIAEHMSEYMMMYNYKKHN